MDKSIRAICFTVVIIAAMIVSLQLYKAWSDHDVVHRQQLMDYEKQKLVLPFFTPQPRSHYQYELPRSPKQA